MAKDKKEYDVFKGLVSGKQIQTLDSDTVLDCVRSKTVKELGADSPVLVLHDPCDIRKPHSSGGFEEIGKVLDLNKQTIAGYKTFNSVAVQAESQKVDFLYHKTYSSASYNYVKESQLKDIDKAPQSVKSLVENDEYINTKKLAKEAVRISSESIKAVHPAQSVCHVLDREFDDNKFFSYIEDCGDDFVIRLKLSRTSHLSRSVYTPKGKLSKRKSYPKLVEKSFEHQSEFEIDKLTIKHKTYHNVLARIEWEELQIEEKTYHVVRIGLYRKESKKPIFSHPMLLLTNRSIDQAEQAKEIYRSYIMRFKIEVMFRFLKQNLGWESFQVRDMASIRNLLSVVVFLAGYYKELEAELKNHPLAQFLCKLANSKGKITLFYLLQGLEKVANYLQVYQWKKENNITDQQLEEFAKELNKIKTQV